MENKWILPAEDNADDEESTRWGLTKNRILNELVVAWDGGGALELLLGTGNHAGRNTHNLPAAILLDPKLPKIDGLGVQTVDREKE